MDTLNEIILLSSRLKQNEEKWNKKTIEDDEFDSENNRINESLISTIDELFPHKVSTKKNKKIQLSNTIRSLLSDTISIVKEEYERDNTNKTAKKILDRLEKIKNQCDNQTFQIAVMALLNSGKSTFLNALLGHTFLPMSNIRETAIPVRIQHSNESNGSLCDETEAVLAESDSIVEYLKKKNEDRREKNTEKDTEYILKAPLQVLLNKDMLDVKFEILDTPGIGEAEIEIIRRRGKKLKKTNQEIIDEIGAIIYLLDYTKLGMEAEDEVLGKLSKLRKDLLDKIQERFFFIINKIDIEENADGLSVEDTKSFVLNTIKSKIPNIRKEQILALSSKNALWARLILSDNMPEKLMVKFKKERFGSKNKDKDYSKKELKDEAKEALDESNLIDVENRIIDYIFNNRYKIYQQTLLSQLERQINLFKNQVISTAKGTLKADKSKIEKLEKKIENAKKKASKIEAKSTDFQVELQKQNYKEFEKFKKKVSNDIKLLFEKDGVETTDKSLLNLIQRKINWFNRQSESENKFITEGVFRSLNQDIDRYVNRKFSEFRANLEKQIIEKQKELFRELQSIIDEMSKEFKKELEKELNIKLKPIYPKLDEFYSGDVIREVSEKIDRFITKSEKIEHIDTLERVKIRTSFCVKPKHIYRNVKMPVVKESYEISEAHVRSYWMERIELRSDNAVELTDRFVKDFIEKQIRDARNSFNEYVGDYMLTVNEEKKNISSGGQSYIENRLKDLGNIDKKLEEILMQISNALNQ